MPSEKKEPKLSPKNKKEVDDFKKKNNYKCDLCNKNISIKKGENRHILLYADSRPALMYCKECNEEILAGTRILPD